MGGGPTATTDEEGGAEEKSQTYALPYEETPAILRKSGGQGGGPAEAVAAAFQRTNLGERDAQILRDEREEPDDDELGPDDDRGRRPSAIGPCSAPARCRGLWGSRVRPTLTVKPAPFTEAGRIAGDEGVKRCDALGPAIFLESPSAAAGRRGV